MRLELNEEAPEPPVKGKPAVLVLSLLGLAAYLAWQAFALRGFIALERRPPARAEAANMRIAQDYAREKPAISLARVPFLAPKADLPLLPPLYHLGLLRFQGGEGPYSALNVNWFFLALLSLSVFGIAYHFKPDESALVAALLFASAPGVRKLYLSQLPDLACAAFVAAAYWALLASEGFRRWVPSVLFGAFCAAGMMFHWGLATYMLPAAVVGLQALGTPGRRLKAFLAAAVALGGCLPWYLAHAPLLALSLSQALEGVWARFSWLDSSVYVLDVAGGLGVALFALGLGGLLSPLYARSTKDGWIIAFWTISTYILWVLVPGHELKSFLPGLSGVAVLGACGPWPRAVLWPLLAFQVFAGVNFSQGWLPSIAIPLPVVHSLSLLQSDPPQRKDWKIAEILQTAQKLHDPRFPIGAMTLVADDERYNLQDFSWQAESLGLPDIRLRPVNARLCELSEFLLLKSGGPAAPKSIEQAAALVLKKGEWFDRSYEQAGRWPLPDGSEALLFKQRRFARPPGSAALAAAGKSDMPEWTEVAQPDSGSGAQHRALILPDWDARQPQGAPGAAPKPAPADKVYVAPDLDVKLGLWDPALGAYRTGRVSAPDLQLLGVPLSNVRLSLSDWLSTQVREDPLVSWEAQQVRLLRLGRLKVESLEVEGEVVRQLLEARVPGLEISKLVLDGDAAIEGRLKGLSFSAVAKVALAESPRRVVVSLREARVGVTPVPDWMLGRLKTVDLPLEPSAQAPLAIELAGLSLKGGRLTVP